MVTNDDGAYYYECHYDVSEFDKKRINKKNTRYNRFPARAQEDESPRATMYYIDSMYYFLDFL